MFTNGGWNNLFSCWIQDLILALCNDRDFAIDEFVNRCKRLNTTAVLCHSQMDLQLTSLLVCKLGRILVWKRIMNGYSKLESELWLWLLLISTIRYCHHGEMVFCHLSLLFWICVCHRSWGYVLSGMQTDIFVGNVRHVVALVWQGNYVSRPSCISIFYCAVLSVKGHTTLQWLRHGFTLLPSKRSQDCSWRIWGVREMGNHYLTAMGIRKTALLQKTS